MTSSREDPNDNMTQQRLGMLITISRKVYAAGFPSVLCLLGLFSWIPSLPAQTAEKIIFSIPSRSIAAIDLYVAKERGFFRGEGLVDIVQIRGNVAIVANLLADKKKSQI